MCDEHAAAGIPCPSMESIGSAVLAAPKVIIGVTLGVSAAVVLSFIIANIVWIGIGLGAAVVVTGTVLVRKTIRNLRDGRVTWQPSMATTQLRLNGVSRPAVGYVPNRPALEAPKSRALPQETARGLAELGVAILASRQERV